MVEKTRFEKALVLIMIVMIFVSFSFLFYVFFSLTQFHIEGEMIRMKILMEAPNQTAAMEWIQNER